MDPQTATILGADERGRAIEVVCAAFAADPVERWLYPGDDEYARHFPGLVAAFGGPTFEGGTAWRLGDQGVVALWLGPGVEADEDAIVATLGDTVAAEKHEEMFDVLGQMAEAHPTDPHWYLPWLAVEPTAQNGGLGGRLLAHCLAVVDESALPAFLETPNPRNVGFYERHGFEVVAVTSSPSCPPLTSMLRPAARAT